MMQGNGIAASRGQGAGLGGMSVFPKRFYKDVAVEREGDTYVLRLDGRAARTPARNPVAVPTVGLAKVIAAEWEAVQDVIDPRRMPLTRFTNTVIDGVTRMQADVLAEINRFAGSDLLLYRAEEPPQLVRAQRQAWDPLIAWSRDELGAPLVLASGVVHVAQPTGALQRLADVLNAVAGAGLAAPFRIAGLHVMTTLTGSALLAAAVASARMSAEEAWTAAHVDDDYQIALWGADEEAAERRAARWIEMKAAADMLRLAGDAA